MTGGVIGSRMRWLWDGLRERLPTFAAASSISARDAPVSKSDRLGFRATDIERSGANENEREDDEDAYECGGRAACECGGGDEGSGEGLGVPVPGLQIGRMLTPISTGRLSAGGLPLPLARAPPLAGPLRREAGSASDPRLSLLASRKG